MDGNYSQSFIVAKEIERYKLLVHSKIVFLEKLSHEVWIYLLKILEVAYNKTYRHREQFEKVYGEYDASSWKHLSSIKGIIGSSVWFTDDDTHNKLNEFYNWLLKIDLDLESMAKSGSVEISKGKTSTNSDKYSKIFNEIYSRHSPPNSSEKIINFTGKKDIGE